MLTDEAVEYYQSRGHTCVDCTFRNDCEDDEICCDYLPTVEPIDKGDAMHESKRERYIRLIKNRLEDDAMEICHELFFTEAAIKEILWLLEDKDKEAEWIRTGEVHDGACGIRYHEIKCSKCGYTTEFAPSEYCKECGSHMIGVRENE